MIIVVGLIVLGIDKFIVQPNEPTKGDLVTAAAQELGMTLHREYAAAGELLELTRQWAGLIEPAENIGAALVRKSDDHELIVYEHRYKTRAIRTGTQSHELEVELLGILIRLPGAELPRFGLRPDGRMAAEDEAAVRTVVSQAAADRMKTFSDFTLVAEGEHLLFLSDPPTSALVATALRQSSPEFLAGLGNSGLKIDVQRALDITNLLKLDRPQLASVYGIDTSEIRVGVEVPELDLGLDETVKETHREIDAIMERNRKQSEARRAKFEADMKAARERMRGNRSGAGSEAAGEEAATTEAQSPEATGTGSGDAATEAPPPST